MFGLGVGELIVTALVFTAIVGVIVAAFAIGKANRGRVRK
jgi:hypothetical protein